MKILMVEVKTFAKKVIQDERILQKYISPPMWDSLCVRFRW